MHTGHKSIAPVKGREKTLSLARGETDGIMLVDIKCNETSVWCVLHMTELYLEQGG